MKNQYFGDQNDYLKYGLLRALTQETGLRVGVAWMLTGDDDRPDGMRTAYWKEPDQWRRHDPELYDRLARLSTQRGARSVELFRRWELVPRALDHDAPLPDGADARVEWMSAVREAFRACPLVFFDPDVGFEVESAPFGSRASNRYLYWDEAVAAWEAKHSLLVYQHFPRETREAFVERLHERARAHLPGARVTTFRADHVVFLLAARPEHAESLERAADKATLRWQGKVTVQRSAPPADRADDLAAATAALLDRGPDAAAAVLAERYAFTPPAPDAMAAADREALRTWVDDGFLDRFDGTRLVFPGALRLLAVLLPEAFPFRPEGDPAESHPAFADVSPALERLEPGADDAAALPRFVTTALRSAGSAAHRIDPEAGGRLVPRGSLGRWDGLTGWFRSAIEARPELLEHAAVRHWSRLLEEVLPRS